MLKRENNMLIVRKRIYPLLIALTFWGILIIPILKADLSISTLENNFLGHNTLIEAFNTIRMRLGDRVFPNVIVGEDGWLFYTAAKTINEFQGTNPYTADELRDIGNEWNALAVQLQEKGAMLVVVIAPDKNTIYPEYIPSQIERIGSTTRLDQFVDYMHASGKVLIIDLRADLIAASENEPVYYKTDTHWNPFGEYIAYSRIISALSQRYPKLEPHPFSDYEVVNGGPVTFGIPIILGLPNIREDYLAIRPKFETGTISSEVLLSDRTNVRLSWNQEQGLPSILIYHDSFFVGVVPLLEPHFRQTTSIPNSTVPGIWSIKWVDQLNPDIVVIECVERYINEHIYIPVN